MVRNHLIVDTFHCLSKSCVTETLALYSLRKYRHLKRMYPEHSHSDTFP